MVAQQNPLLLPIAKILRTAATPLSEYDLLTHLDFSGLNLDEEIGLSEATASESDPGSSTGQADLLLFRKHFLVMNALYSLQPIFWEEGLQLKISALEIALLPVTDTTVDQQLADTGEQAIREYYLDWQQFTDSSCGSVAALLQSFWQRYQAYYASDKTLAALRCLGFFCDELSCDELACDKQLSEGLVCDEGTCDKDVCDSSNTENNETENLTAQLSLSQIKQAYRRLAASHHPDKGGHSERFMEIREAYEHLACLYSG